MKYLLLLLLIGTTAMARAQKKKSVKKTTAVSKKTADTTGTLSGKVTIAPLCPIEPCKPTAEQLAAACKSLQLLVTQPDKKWMSKYALDPKGNFMLKLPAGNYNILVSPKEGASLENRVYTANVEARKTTTLTLNYNTGMQ